MSENRVVADRHRLLRQLGRGYPVVIDLMATNGGDLFPQWGAELAAAIMGSFTVAG